VGELGGGLEGLRLGEAAGGDEVVLDSEARVWGKGVRGGGEEPVERVDGGGGRREEMGEDGVSEAEHVGTAAPVPAPATGDI
jgi:hypothetical protein